MIRNLIIQLVIVAQLVILAFQDNPSFESINSCAQYTKCNSDCSVFNYSPSRYCVVQGVRPYNVFCPCNLYGTGTIST